MMFKKGLISTIVTTIITTMTIQMIKMIAVLTTNIISLSAVPSSPFFTGMHEPHIPPPISYKSILSLSTHTHTPTHTYTHTHTHIHTARK